MMPRRSCLNRAAFLGLRPLLSILVIAGAATASRAQPGAPSSTSADVETRLPLERSEVVVTASRLNLLGVASTASQGSVTKEELDLRPVYRVGQLLEAIPGLVVTVHSGEGKANQYLLRGFNLDHGTDIANFVDDMPINRPTNTHGQGYSDVNFEVAPMAAGLDYTKGPYYAAVGDFGAVASTHLKLANEIADQISITGGTLGVYNLFAGGTQTLSAQDRLVGGFTYGHVDGPFDHPDNFRKYAAELRYSHGVATDGYSITALYYKGDGSFTTDQPINALNAGLIDRFGTLDPTDGNTSERFSLSGHYAVGGAWWTFNAGAYYIDSRMTLWNNFTHYLYDQINGDQEQQDETRNTVGGQAAITVTQSVASIEVATVVGLQVRDDDAYVDRRHTVERRPLDYCSDQKVDGSTAQIAAVVGACQADRVHLLDLGPYVDTTIHWASWLRTILGLRDEEYFANDHSFISGFRGHQSQALFQPKGSMVFGPFYKTEVYLSAGRGFHSDDVRGVFGTVPLEGEPGAAGKTPLLAAANGYEAGVRSDVISKLQVQVALFEEDFKSELAYDADQGQDTASAPSRRRGVEFSAQYKPWAWLEFNTDLAFSRARYDGSAATLAAFNLNGPFIANAPSFIGSFGVLADRGPWFGGLQWRDLGAYPISDGAAYPQDRGYSEFNADIGYRVNKHLTVAASGFNLLNARANSSSYDYSYRLTRTSLEETGPTFHPLEPTSGQVKLSWIF